MLVSGLLHWEVWHIQCEHKIFLELQQKEGHNALYALPTTSAPKAFSAEELLAYVLISPITGYKGTGMAGRGLFKGDRSPRERNCVWGGAEMGAELWVSVWTY